MKLLITGGCGFLGSNLADEALKRGHELTLLDDLSRHGAAENLRWLRRHGDFHFVRGDIRDFNVVSLIVQEAKADAVFHLAGQVAMTTSIANPRLDFDINVLGTVNLLEALRAADRAVALIHASTNKVYGNLENYIYRECQTRYVCVNCPNGFDEQTPLEFRTPYGCSKGAADQYVLEYMRQYGVRGVVLRHSSMYGGRQFATADQGWIGWFCQKAVEATENTGAVFSIAGNGKQVRDILHADDMVTLYFGLINRIDTVAGHAFNVGGGAGNSLSLLELFGLLESLTGARMEYRCGPPRDSDQKVFISNLAKVTDMTGWNPVTDCVTGVRSMLAWTKER